MPLSGTLGETPTWLSLTSIFDLLIKSCLKYASILSLLSSSSKEKLKISDLGGRKFLIPMPQTVWRYGRNIKNKYPTRMWTGAFLVHGPWVMLILTGNKAWGVHSFSTAVLPAWGYSHCDYCPNTAGVRVIQCGTSYNSLFMKLAVFCLFFVRLVLLLSAENCCNYYRTQFLYQSGFTLMSFGPIRLSSNTIFFVPN